MEVTRIREMLNDSILQLQKLDEINQNINEIWNPQW